MSTDPTQPPDTPEPAPPGTPAISERILQFLVSLIPSAANILRLGFLIAILVVAAEFFKQWAPPVWPFVTRGAIYVDSPEVYTRERLVNDRYDQDHWLHRQLEELDKTKLLFSEYVDQQRVAGTGGEGTPPAIEPGSPEDAISEPAFLQVLETRSSIRAILRQQILENMLDDRHDLSGNSLYGFKFDTTIIPGRNTRDKAFVRMSVELDEPVRLTEGDPDPRRELDDLILASLNLDPVGVYDRSLIMEFQEREKLAENWAKSIQDRLNRFVAQAINADPELCKGTALIRENPETYKVEIGQNTHDLSRQALTAVLSLGENEILTNFAPFATRGIALDEVTPDKLTRSVRPRPAVPEGQEQDAQPSQIVLSTTAPWRDFIEIVLLTKGFSDCIAKPTFKVSPIRETYYLIKRGPDDRFPKWAKEFRRKKNFEDSEILKGLSLASAKSNIPAEIDYEIGSWSITPSQALLEKLMKSKKINGFCWAADENNNCADGDNMFIFSVNSGTINLVRKLAEQDAYAYAMLPKSDATSVLVNEVSSFSARSAPGALGWLLGGRDASRRSESRSQLVGFGDSRRRANDQKALNFGWVLDPGKSDQPLQRTQMALISVPAYADNVTLDVTLGWLDRHARERPADSQDSYQLKVPLPPDFETFETIIFDRSNDVRRRPFIFDQFIGQDEKTGTLRACARDQILIPGSRLWRSTAVTLGPHRASRIVVLPNMEGIIAQFDDLPPSPAGQKLALRVWTSEGTVKSERSFTVKSNSGKKDCDPPE